MYTVVNVFDPSLWLAFVLYAHDAATLHGVRSHGVRLG